MELLGSLMLLVLAASLMMFGLTGVRQWFCIWFFALPLLGMTLFPSSKAEINGLVVLIALLLLVLTVYALSGISLWCFEKRKVNRVFFGISVVFFYLVLVYFCYHVLIDGNLAFLHLVLPHYPANVVSLVAAVPATAMVWFLWLQATEKFFSQPGVFVMIKCRPRRKKGWYFGGSPLAMEGIQNGKTYLFFATRRAYLLLRPEKQLKLSCKIGVFGGIYARKNLLQEPSLRRKRNVTRKLAKQAVATGLIAGLILLFVVRVGYGVDFETMFTFLKRGLF